ncbi:hypothetical protein CIB48_g1021 [Xylaria polymorpha]|nr:hypothetical protein CIB48_g1021 [Xylaria polymorpha]
MRFPRAAVSTAGKGIRALGISTEATPTPTPTRVRAFSSLGVTSTNTSACSITATATATITKLQQTRPTCLRSPNCRQTPTPHSRKAYTSSASSKAPLGKTALYDLHLAHGAKMVPFGGFNMPVQYSNLGVNPHHFTRKKASLFDVGHMVQHWFKGPGATAFLQRITPASLETLPDLAYLEEQLVAWDGADVSHQVLDKWGLIALQGPLSEKLLSLVLEDIPETNLRKLYFGQSCSARVEGAQAPVLISRGGLQLAGLGARDSLRLEAGMCLYGHDLDDSTTPVEASLAWIVGKERRTPASDADKFHGADVVLAQLTPKSKGGSGVARRRVGLVVEGAPAREGAEIVFGDTNEKIGVVTSGCPSPTLGKNIAMGYVQDGLHKAGTEVQVVVRGRSQKAVVTKMPFVPAKYYKAPASSA